MFKQDKSPWNRIFLSILVSMIIGAVIFSTTLLVSWVIDINITSIAMWTSAIITFFIIFLILVLPDYYKLIPVGVSLILLPIYINYVFELNILPSIVASTLVIVLILFIYLSL